MRKTVVLFTSMIALFGGLVSCGSNPDPFLITYKSAVNSLHTINYTTLNNKIKDKDINESFILLLYDSNSPSCSCWTLFREFLLNEFIPETNDLFYVMGTNEFLGKDTFGINISVHQPSICFFKQTTLVKQIDYANHPEAFTPSDDGTGHLNCKNFRNLMNSYTIQQEKIYKYDTYESVLDNEKGCGLSYKDKAIFYAYKTTCPDCKDATTKVLFPYLNTKSELQTKIYILDIDKYANNMIYQDVKDELELSNKYNEAFGYDTGYVPTFQYRENGVIKDASVFYNDSIEKQDNLFVVSNSYYTTERRNNTSYTYEPLKGMTIDQQYVGEYEDDGVTKYYWKTENAITYHKPILESFLTTYVK